MNEETMVGKVGWSDADKAREMVVVAECDRYLWVRPVSGGQPGTVMRSEFKVKPRPPRIMTGVAIYSEIDGVGAEHPDFGAADAVSWIEATPEVLGVLAKAHVKFEAHVKFAE
jgi:hypothetical protein